MMSVRTDRVNAPTPSGSNRNTIDTVIRAASSKALITGRIVFAGI